jgi:hypothetical protein
MNTVENFIPPMINGVSASKVFLPQNISAPPFLNIFANTSRIFKPVNGSSALLIS